MLRAYFDDAWDDEVFVISGFLATAEEWAQFSDDWKRALDTPPRADLFVMNDAVNMQGEFRFSRESDRDEKISMLEKIIFKYKPQEVFTMIPLHEFRKLFASSELPAMASRLKRRYVKMMVDPYYHALCAIVSGLSSYQLSRGIAEKIDFIFDEKKKHEPRVRNAWYEMIKDQPNATKQIIGSSPLFLDDSRVQPLQAADMAAWWRREKWQEIVSGGNIANRWNTTVLGMLILSK